MAKVEQFVAELADREAIRDCLFRYCRGIDRLDADLLRDVYWADAIDEHTGFIGSGDEFIEFVIPILKPLEQTMHMLGNILIAINGDFASSEAYFHAFHRIPQDGNARDLIVGGRYLDKMEKRDDEWRIAHRVVIIDWFRHYENSADWTKQPLAMDAAPGERMPTDRSYALMNEWNIVYR